MPTSKLVLKVATDTDVNSLAGMIMHAITEHGYAECMGVGAGPTNQIVKAVARARQWLGTEEDLCMIPDFYREPRRDQNNEEYSFVCMQITIIKVHSRLDKMISEE